MKNAFYIAVIAATFVALGYVWHVLGAVPLLM